MFEISKTRLASVTFSLFLMILCAPATAQQPVQLVTCAIGSESVIYNPGLTFTERYRHISVSGNYGGCLAPGKPNLVSGTTSFEFNYKGSCLTPLDTSLPDNRKINWNTGDASDLSGKVILNDVAGTLSVTIVGEVKGGLFQGAAYQLQITNPTLDIISCLGPTGITTTGGPAILTITGI